MGRSGMTCTAWNASQRAWKGCWIESQTHAAEHGCRSGRVWMVVQASCSTLSCGQDSNLCGHRPPNNPADPLPPDCMQVHRCLPSMCNRVPGKRMQHSSNRCRTRLPGWRSSALLTGLAPQTGPAPSVSRPELESLVPPCTHREHQQLPLAHILPPSLQLTTNVSVLVSG